MHQYQNVVCNLASHDLKTQCLVFTKLLQPLRDCPLRAPDGLSSELFGDFHQDDVTTPTFHMSIPCQLTHDPTQLCDKILHFRLIVEICYGASTSFSPFQRQSKWASTRSNHMLWWYTASLVNGNTTWAPLRKQLDPNM